MLRNIILSIGVAGAMVTLATPPVQAQTSDERRATSDEAGFWLALNDTTLNRLMKEALANNRELRAASMRTDAAGAARTQAALNLVPTVTASAGYTRQRIASATFPLAGAGTLPDQGLWDSGLNVAWEPDLFGRLRGGLRAQNAQLGSAEEDLRHTQVQLTAEVARSYLDLRGAQEQLAVAKRNADNQRRTLELTEHRFEAGRGTAFDKERASAQLNFTLAAIPALEAQVASAQYRLAVLTGNTPNAASAALLGDGALPILPDSIAQVDPLELIRARPDVRSAENQVAASRALVSSARADYLPRITVTAGAGYTANAVDAFGRNGTFNYMVGPVISWPAFDMGRVKARVDEAQSQQLAARARYEQATLMARQELETADVQYRSARARLQHLRAAADASERAAQLARLRYEGGVADFLQVLDAERTLLAAQDQLAQGQTQAASAFVALHRARGADWTPVR